MRGDPSVWTVPDLRSPSRATELLTLAGEGQDGCLKVDLTHTKAVYSNGAVPFALTLAFLEETQPGRIQVLCKPDQQVSCISKPLFVAEYDRKSRQTLTNSVWRYNSETEAQQLTNLFTEALVDRVRCEEGVIDAITWCLYEVLDNVFQHSHAEAGYVMMQLHREQRLCAIAVGDAGIGIQKSLALTRSAPLDVLRDPALAIQHALGRGVTSKDGQNQGNGLYGLRRAVEINGGRLSVRSGWGSWTLKEGETSLSVDRNQPLLDKEHHQSTLVDWQLDCSRRVRIDEALGSVRPQGGEFLESIEDDQGVHRILVSEIEESLGSRKLGSEVRMRLTNYLDAGARFVMLDFKGVGVVSSSFADEVLAKLAAEMGELDFRRRVFVDSVSATNRGLIETAIAQRLGRLD